MKNKATAASPIATMISTATSTLLLIQHSLDVVGTPFG